MTQTFFNMTNKLEAVDPMVLSLKAAVEGRLAKSTLFSFQICISEALTNVIEHASGSSDDKIEIVLHENQNEITVDVFDLEGAVPFDLREHATNLSTVDAMSEGGRGLGLIAEYADRVEYGPLDGRNRLSLGFDRNA